MEEDSGETAPNPIPPENTTVIKDETLKKEASNEDKEEKTPEVAASSVNQPPAPTTGNAATPVAAVPANESEGDESEDDESEILEESPCGRWLKRREVVSYRDVPGIDCAYLAMDTEEGVEVVWNEATFSEAKKFKAQEDKLRSVFEILTLIDHPNIVKFHKYWTEMAEANMEKPRVVSLDTLDTPFVASVVMSCLLPCHLSCYYHVMSFFESCYLLHVIFFPLPCHLSSIMSCASVSMRNVSSD